MKKVIFCILILLVGVWLYTSSLIGVHDTSKSYLNKLELALKDDGYQANYFVISGRRWPVDNYLLNKLGGASKKSRHLRGQAIDIIVLDVNQDGKRNAQDVDIVYNILDKRIIKDKGGIGTYKKESGFFSRQMIHFDCRGKRARWHR